MPKSIDSDSFLNFFTKISGERTWLFVQVAIYHFIAILFAFLAYLCY